MLVCCFGTELISLLTAVCLANLFKTVIVLNSKVYFSRLLLIVFLWLIFVFLVESSSVGMLVVIIYVFQMILLLFSRQ